MIKEKNSGLSLSAYTSFRTTPINLKEEDTKLFQKEFKRDIPSSSIRQFSQVFILEDSILDWKSLSILDFLTHPQPLSQAAKLKRFVNLVFPTKKLEKALWITDLWGHNYFHWMTETLTRLACLDGGFKEYQVILPEYLKNLLYVTETLEMLGYKWIYVNKKVNFFVGELISFERTAPSFNYHQKAICKLRQYFRGMENSHFSKKKIYISRKKATKRKLINEETLTPQLIQLGYEIHYFEEYTLQQQIEVMLQASHLISMHGAGLTNMLYMKAGSKILEFRFKGDDSNNCFFSLASDLGHSYFYSLNEFETPKIHLNSNMILNVQEALKAIKLMENF